MPEIQDFKKASASAQGISGNLKMYPCIYVLPTRLSMYLCNMKPTSSTKDQASLLLVDVVFANLLHDSSY